MMRAAVRVFRLSLAAILLAGLAQAAPAQTHREAIRSVLPKVVKIFGAGGLRGLYAYGTGLLVTDEGHIVTVWSHVLDADLVTIVLDDGRRFDAKVLGAEPQLDLAVLKIQADELDLPHFDLNQADTAGPGTRVLAFSNMYKVATGDEPVSVLHGVISARTELTARRGAFEVPYTGSVYVLDAITNNPGAGGGVVTTRDGRLLGMIGKQLRNAESNTWINYAVPIPEIRDVVKQIITGVYEREKQPETDGNPNRYGPLDFGIVMIPDVLYRTPAYVAAVLPDSAAQQAGLRPDDLVIFVGDELIHSIRMLKEQLGRLKEGERVRLVVKRGERLIEFDLPVEKKGT